jgi:hypothetical protein
LYQRGIVRTQELAFPNNGVKLGGLTLARRDFPFGKSLR